MVHLRIGLFAALLTAATLIGVAAAWPAHADATPAQARSGNLPIELFFANPQFGAAVLSPSGRYLAARSGAPGRRDALGVIDLQSDAFKVVAYYSNVDVLQFQWVNDERLMFNVQDKQVGPGAEYLASGLYAVDRDGANLRQLASRNGYAGEAQVGSRIPVAKMLPWHTYMLPQPGAQDSDWVYVRNIDYDARQLARSVSLLHLNTRTGQTRKVAQPGEVDYWLLDHAGQPRLAGSTKQGHAIIHYADPASNQWRVIARFNAYAGDEQSFKPVGFGADGKLYVTANGKQDKQSLTTFNFATDTVNPEPLIVTDGYDFHGAIVNRRDKLLGFTLLTDAYSSVWFDPAMAALQKKIDALLPATNNLISVAADPGAPWVLVRAYSDRQPMAWMVYHVESGKLKQAGVTYAGIDAARMGRQQAIKYQARDGREIQGLLTLPPGGGKNLPLVMLVHGGPYVRANSWGWDAESQFLASRGYAVLEPAFRGSTGLGSAHFRAGWKQWGLAMQDDIADAARWAIAQGHADPKRICIAGASYGGYATLMGLVRDPDLYRCGINWLGVTDINLLYDGHWTRDSDLDANFKKYGMPLLVGDQVKDAAQLKATSPIEQAARITQPLMLAYGGADRRVPIYHGTKLRDAVGRTNKQVQWIEYPDEGHGWSLPQTRIDFWSRVEKFLDTHIGKNAPQ